MNTHQKIGYTILIAAVVMFFVFLNWCIFSDKYVKEYTLGSGGIGMYIIVNWENASDGYVPMSGITPSEAVRIVDSLNASLHRYPHITK